MTAAKRVVATTGTASNVARLADARRVAFCMSNHIGDTLVGFVIVERLVAGGREVVVHGTVADALRRWFPRFEIRPLPPAGTIAAALAPFDLVIQMHRHQPYAVEALGHPRVVTLGEVEVAPGPDCMAERFAAFCERAFALDPGGIGNGLVRPRGVRARLHPTRVIVHPEANADDKRWSRSRFLRLAAALAERGCEPVFILAPHERARWPELERLGIAAPRFDDLDALAVYIAESGWFIGNDSGIGHLASNLGVPALSLFRRRRVAERWRPAWHGAMVVLPWQWVPTARLKERFWRQTLTVGRVLRAFEALRRRAPVGGVVVPEVGVGR